MSNKRVFELTQDGVDKLREELTDLIDNKRPQNLSLLKEARAQGDLSENADYDAARNEQARIEGRVVEIERILKNVKIIKTTDNDTIEIGKVVVVKYLETGLVKEFRLVGTLEANPMENKLSIDSPIGRVLLGHEKGDKVVIKTPTNDTYNIEIMEVSNEAS